ncbi:twin-arginine translocase TatA/TatE family subunit [Chloroflexota bacterium]
MDFFGIGALELVLILIVLLIVVGPTRLPEIASSIGRGIRKFKMATAELSREVQNMADEEKAAGQQDNAPAEAGTDVIGDLKEVAKEVGSLRREIDAALSPKGELMTELKEISGDLTEVGEVLIDAGKDMSASLQDEGSPGSDIREVGKEVRDVAHEISEAVELSPEEEVDKQAGEGKP